MRGKMLKLLVMAGVLALVAAACGTDDEDGAEPTVGTYEITITNLSAGQPLTPPILVAHGDELDLYDTGAAASDEVKEIAENGNLMPMAALLEGADTVQAEAPLVPADTPGAAELADSVTLSLTTDARQLSWVSMLICTNDGFTGLDGVALPSGVGESATFETKAYDAGTEENTETLADMVPPCQGLIGVTSDAEGTGASNPDLAEDGTVSAHAGIVGEADLDTETHAFEDPVASVVVERTS